MIIVLILTIVWATLTVFGCCLMSARADRQGNVQQGNEKSGFDSSADHSAAASLTPLPSVKSS